MNESPANWCEVALGEICEFKYGKSLPDAIRAGGNVPVFGSNGVVGQHNESITVAPVIVVGRKGSLGEVNFSSVPCWPIDTTYYIDSTATGADLRWLAYRLAGLGLTKLNKAAAVPGLNREDAYRKRLLLPPLAEQRRIAEVLDRVEALRAKRRAAVAQLDTLTQSIFLDLFGDPITNPKGWPTVEFSQICERVTVGIVVKPASYYVPKGIPALRSLNVKPGKILMEDLVYFSETDNETKLAKTRLKAGDIVLVRSGQPGTAAVVPPELDGINAIDLLIATPAREKCDTTFLCAFFNSSGGRGLVLSSQRGQVQKHLNVGSLNEAVIPFPPLQTQREFARRIAAVDKLKSAHRASLAKLDALFASLQHRAFRGEL